MADPTEITLDKSDPSVAAAFKDCKPGDTYTVTAADDTSVTMDYAPAAAEDEGAADTGAETGEEPGETGMNPAVMAMAKKRGM